MKFNNTHIGSRIIAVMAMVLGFCALYSCSEKEEPASPDSIEIFFKGSEGSKAASDVILKLTCDNEWKLSIQYEVGQGWAHLNADSGKGNKTVIMSFDQNNSGEIRTLFVIGTSGSQSDTAYFVQRKTDQKIYREDPVGKWMELPEVKSDDGLAFYMHDMTLGTKTTRNYSFYWDVDNLVARWVAYPLNRWTIGSGNRTDAWGTLDPKLPASQQPILEGGFKGYDRGHQIPSADRLYGPANVATFYGTNMTPQLGSLNQRGWADLEGKVRTWSGQFDTLYVVTGCCVEGSRQTVKDNEGKDVTVPTAYYKALLGYNKAVSEYYGIGFYYPHEGYSGDCMNKSMSLSALEQKVGVNFFVNLPDSKAAVVKSTVDPRWKTKF